MGDKNYSSLVRITNAGNHIYNAPIVAFGVSAQQISFPNGNPDYRVVHDKVVRIDPAKMTVTLKLTPGFSFARPVMYLSFDSNEPVTATLEASTLAPGLSDIGVGRDDSAFSAVERLFVFANAAAILIFIPVGEFLSSRLLHESGSEGEFIVVKPSN